MKQEKRKQKDDDTHLDNQAMIILIFASHKPYIFSTCLVPFSYIIDFRRQDLR